MENNPEDKKPSLDSTMIVPRIKADYAHKIYATDQEKKFVGKAVAEEAIVPPHLQPFTNPLFEDLNLIFAFDLGDQYQILNNETVEVNPDLTSEYLLQASNDNMLNECGSDIKMNGNPEELVMIMTGGNFEASLILVNNFWKQINDIVNEDLIVSLPTQDVLFISPESSVVGIAKQKTAIKKFFENPETQGLISKALYKRNRQTQNFEIVDIAF